ncbi:MAG: metallophosphoesterase [Bacteroidetes bacterium]|nr:metallophosphoesterase [Bacteroidota bacterium]
MKKLILISTFIILAGFLFGQAIQMDIPVQEPTQISDPDDSKSDFLKQPYLIFEGINTQMRVIWQLSETATCSISWGTDSTYSLGNATTTEYGNDHQHGYTITGLVPGAKYHYKVVYSDAVLEASFKTAPPDNTTDLKFFMYGDTRTQFAVHDEVSEAMIADYTADTEFQTITICTGDLVTFGAEESLWQNEFFSSGTSNIRQRMAEVPFVSCLGNHELYYNNYTGVNMTSALFGKYFPYPFVERRYWSFDYGPVHFTYIDLYPSYYDPYGQGLIDDDQLEWIENDLSSTTKEWKIVVMHEPGWSAGGSSSGSPHPNNEDVQNLLQPLCEQYGVQLVFGGHNHYFAKACKNGIYHLTAAGGGAPLYSPDPDHPNVMKTRQIHHYCKAEIVDTTLSVTVLTPDGELVDEITIEKNFLPGHLLGYLNKEDGYGDISDVLIEVDGEIAQPDSIGYYGLQLDAGNYNVTFSLGGYESITETIEIFEGTETQLDTMIMLGQSCLPEGITFTTQEQIDNFQNDFPNCTEIEGNVQIEGDEITNLNGLSVLTNIGGRLRFYTCTALPDLTGLENLTTIGGDLIIYVWPNNTTSLTTLSGLDNLISVGGALEVTGTDVLINLSGLENLTNIGENFEIAGNEVLTDLSGLDNLTSVGGDIWIGENASLTSLSGLDNLTTVGGSVEIYDNDALTSLIGIKNIEAASINNYLSISYNSSLSACAVQSICDYIAIPGSNVDVYDNAPGCNTIEEVEEACLEISVDEFVGNSEISISPNPIDDLAFLSLNIQSKNSVEICIYNTTGSCLKSWQFQDQQAGQKEFVIDLKDLQAGVYFCRVQINERIITRKIIKINP